MSQPHGVLGQLGTGYSCDRASWSIAVGMHQVIAMTVANLNTRGRCLWWSVIAQTFWSQSGVGKLSSVVVYSRRTEDG